MVSTTVSTNVRRLVIARRKQVHPFVERSRAMSVVPPTLISMGAVYVRLVLSWAYRFGRRYIHKDNENTGFSDAFPWMGVRWKHSR